MTKKEILKITGLTEADFYNKYPTEESFMKEYGGKIAGYASGGKVSYSAKDAAAGKDIGKPGKNFSKIASKAARKYGSKEAGERVAGAVLAKLRGKHEKGGSILPTPDMDIFGMMGLPQINAYAQGGDVQMPMVSPEMYEKGSYVKYQDYMNGKYADGGVTYDAYMHGKYKDGGVTYDEYMNGMYKDGGVTYDQYMHGVYKSGGGIYIKPSKRGTFTAAAKKHGKSVQAFASQVLANKENYSPAMVKKANFARNAAKWKHEDGGGIDNFDVKAPLYDETELNPNINTNLYANGGFLNQGLINAYAKGGYVPMYALGDTVSTIGAGLYGAGEGVLDTLTMGATDQLTDMGYQGLQKAGGAKNTKQQNLVRGAGNVAGGIAGTAVNPAAATSGVGQMGKGLNTMASTSDNSSIQGLGQLAGMAGTVAGFAGGSGPSSTGNLDASMGSSFLKNATTTGNTFNQMMNPMGMFMKYSVGGDVNRSSIHIFADGGTTIGNVESNELLIDPGTYGAGGVPKVLADYTNLPSHPEDGSIDDRGTVTLPVNKFIVTKKMRTMFDKAEQSNDGLLAAAVTNKVAFDKNKKEQAEMQEASTAYNKFMAKYGGTIQKMYNCGGKTYGCGGMTKKYADGADTNSWIPSWLSNPNTPSQQIQMPVPYAPDYNMMSIPTMGSSLPQGGMNLSLPSGSNMGNALPNDWNSAMRSGVMSQPQLNTPSMGSSLPQGWNLQTPSQTNGWKLNASLNKPSMRMDVIPMTSLGITGTSNNTTPLASNSYKGPGMVSKRDLSDYDVNKYAFKPNVWGQAASMLPSAILGTEALLSKPFSMNASDYMVNERLTPQKPVPNYRPLRESEMRTAYDLSQMAPGSGGYLAARTSLGNRAMGLKQDYLRGLQDEYSKQKLSADQFNIGIQGQNKQTAMAIDQFNEENRAARRNAIREQFGKNLPASFFNQQYNNMAMQAIQTQYPTQQFNWGLFGKSTPMNQG